MDKWIGGKIRDLRRRKKWSQEKLGNFLNVSRQQISKYEQGTKAIPVTALYKIACQFNVEMSYFFPVVKEMRELEELAETQPVLSHEAAKLVNDFEAVQSIEVRKEFASILQRVAELSKDHKKN